MPAFERVQLHETPRERAGYIHPFSHRPVKIFQGYNGPYSHMAFYTFLPDGSRGALQDDRFSLDFELPVGSVVLAAKDGIVRTAYDMETEYYTGTDFEVGMKQIPNVVYLQHADGSHTVYSHLAANSITVREGDHIGQGHELARTGLSGWIGPVPHLHFAALTFPSPMVRRTFPVRFSDDSRMLESDGLEQKMDSGEDTDPEGFSYG